MDMAYTVGEAVERQLALLSRQEIARQALASSRLIVAKDLAQCIEISNAYGPEHLILQTREPEAQLTPQGLLDLATTIETLAQAEQLTAHKNAVTLRVNVLKEQGL
ncbi:hypothetical protein GCM10011328_06820 [Hafnia psychrotolerans]|uniref:histidinol dehydrogenase n=1 Tax=Hafnia psychrotolerans TaxID=1477018 RepID=A0ABQ1FZW3_9GAMM|nr:hypothetical protein GCM10011328_06820 [Hafnia psychrotolerans]